MPWCLVASPLDCRSVRLGVQLRVSLSSRMLGWAVNLDALSPTRTQPKYLSGVAVCLVSGASLMSPILRYFSPKV